MARPSRLILCLALLAGCTGDGNQGRPTTTTTAPGPPAPPPAGGSVRVAVWDEPDPAAATLGGAGVRALVLPQLFTPQPDGTWAPSLAVEDRDGPDLRSASFRLREGAAWSDGTPITVEDLRRTADARFVAGIDEAGGTVTVRFTERLPDWRRLWSGVDSVAAPGEGVWGGPFTVAGRTPGLETVLRRNDRWYGGVVSIDEVRLVLVPDGVTARKLLERGELDVVMPPAATVRTEQLRRVEGVEVAVAPRSGWSVELVLEPSRLSPERRRDVIDSVDRDRFVTTLLRDEAVVPPFEVRPGPVGDIGTVDLVGMYEEPMTGLLQRSMQRRAKPGGGRFELRNAEADRVQGWVARREFDAAVVPAYDPPGACRSCRWGDAVVPLWESKVVVAWRTHVKGVRANGYALTAAWDAFAWRLGATNR